MKSILFSAMLLLFVDHLASAQEKYTLSGYVKDGSNGEALIGATVFVRDITGGTVTNVYGFYSLTLPAGTYQVDYRSIGFQMVSESITLDNNVRRDIELPVDDIQLEEVVVTAEKDNQNVASLEMSTIQLDMKSIEKMPAFAGEVDIVKSIQLLPGVTTVGEGAAGFNVRGGSVGQNLILLDEAPVYQSSHLFGFFSVFNPDAVKDVKLYKGGIPANYGGRLSSILDVRMKEGNNKKYEVTGGIGTVFSRLAVEGPIQKDKSSFIIAGRRSYIDILARPFTDILDDGAGLFFYDLTAKTNFNLNDRNRLFVSGYLGRDVFNIDANQGFEWGNATATVRWNHLFSDKLFSNYTFFYSDFDYGFSFGDDPSDQFDWESHIITYDFKPEFTYFLNAKNEITFGGEALLYNFEPATAAVVSNGEGNDISLEERRALEAAIYAGNRHEINDKLSLEYGLRLSHFSYLGGTVYEYGDTIPGVRRPLLSTEEKDTWESIQTYTNLEPRFSFRYQLDDQSSIKGSYNRMNQYIHLISNTTAATPTDIWVPSTNNIEPQQADQVALGYFKNLGGNKYEFSAEVYYKWMDNQIDYIDGAELFINEFLESEVLPGIGKAYGLELYAKKNTGRLTGWASYTLGWSEMKVDGINFGDNVLTREGEWYFNRFDQRHNLSIAAFYQLNSRMTLSSNFSYISGTPTTYPSDRVTVQGYVIPYIGDNSRNNFRIPDFHRLDLSWTIENIWRGKKGRSGEDSFVVSFYNVYLRRNPFSVFFSQGGDRPEIGQPINTQATQLSIVGTIIPSISYNFKF